jgi:hypothetical protein
VQNAVKILESIDYVGAKIMASSANNKSQSYKDKISTNPGILLPLVVAYNADSTYFWMRSKKIANNWGEHGHPCFRPMRILMRSALLIPSSLTLAFKSIYNIFSAFTKDVSKFNSSIKVLQRRSLLTVS